MALNIKDPETDRLVRELAQETGEPITVATRTAVLERLQRVRALKATRGPDQLEAIVLRGRARATLDSRTEDAILGYGDTGLPE